MAATSAPTVTDSQRTGVAQVELPECTRKNDFSKWYQKVIKIADLAEPSAVRGCMVIKPNGYAIWERVQRQLDDRFKEGDLCQNAYFPLFIPVEFFEKEATHVAGFAKECAVVTHYRMRMSADGKMEPDPDAKLDKPLIVRPTSETIIGDSMSKWIQSHRDLPLKLNQWCNVVRWEHHTRPFLRTTEFLWQEGHCAFSTEATARENALKMAQVYSAFMTQECAMPVILGEKSSGERFAGAVQTYCLEAMMQDGKAVQAGTSHYLGQNFAKASEIQFTDVNNEKQYAHTTSWGVSTRLIGSLIMVHSDDSGLRLPPRLAVHHVVILPSQAPSKERDDYIAKIKNCLKGRMYEGQPLSVHVDQREGMNAGEKGRDWVNKGAPMRLEIGPREAKAATITVFRRDQNLLEKTLVKADEIAGHVIQTLGEIQVNYYAQAKAFMDSHIRIDITTPEQIKAFFADPENMGFVRAKWCGKPETEEMLKEEYGVTIRCLPLDQKMTEGPCVLTGEPATIEAVFGRSY